MSNRLGGFIAGQNINAPIGTFTATTSPTFTFASTSATPAVGQAVQFITTGTLPTGLSINTNYYVISVSTNTCQFSTTISGSAVTFTNGSGSGTHTAVTQRPFNPYAGVTETVEYLVVAGGGSGATGSSAVAGGGGGGAGGLLTAPNFNVAAGTAYTVTIGAGGAGIVGGSTNGNPGSDSVFSSITCLGGGYGAKDNLGSYGSRGSGGGGNPGGAGTSGQGNYGSTHVSNAWGGAGGGAGSPGTVPVAAGGNGGAGLCSTITGQRVIYAGGGGGGANGREGGFGGGGGATNGTTDYVFSLNAQANTGGGSGGTGSNSYYGASSTSGSGGSGIVVVRYPQLNAAPALVTGSPQVRYADGYQIYIWTSSGSIIF
jgi:hypothetical protein